MSDSWLPSHKGQRKKWAWFTNGAIWECKPKMHGALTKASFRFRLKWKWWEILTWEGLFLVHLVTSLVWKENGPTLGYNGKITLIKVLWEEIYSKVQPYSIMVWLSWLRSCKRTRRSGLKACEWIAWSGQWVWISSYLVLTLNRRYLLTKISSFPPALASGNHYYIIHCYWNGIF